MNTLKKFQRCSSQNHWEWCFVFMETILKVTFIYFVHKQKCGPLKNRIKENMVMALCVTRVSVYGWSDSRSQYPSWHSLFLTILSPSEELAEEWVVKTRLKSLGNSSFEEIWVVGFFAFFKDWNQSKVLMLMNIFKVTTLSCNT